MTGGDMETEVGPVTLPFTSLFMNGPSVSMSLLVSSTSLMLRSRKEGTDRGGDRLEGVRSERQEGNWRLTRLLSHVGFSLHSHPPSERSPRSEATGGRGCGKDRRRP